MNVFLIPFILISHGVRGSSVEHETAIRTELFTNRSYDLKVRPNPTVLLQVRLNLLTINHMDILEQSFKVTGWLTVEWHDKRLSWMKPSNESVGFIFATEEKVWRPALIVSNSINHFEIIQDEYCPFRIDNTGRIIWDPPGIYEVNCKAEITYYPFDTQECSIILQSWGYNLREVNITVLDNAVNTRLMKPNGEWDMERPYYEIVRNRDIKQDDYSQIRFHFKLRRRSQYYWLNIILPVIVNSVLTALVFALPAESGEKIGYSLTVLLSFIVLLTLVAYKIPSISLDTSLIVVYVALVLILGAMSVFFTTIVLDLYFRDVNESIPVWLLFLFQNIMGRLVFYKGCKRRQFKKKVNRVISSVEIKSIKPKNENDEIENPTESQLEDTGERLLSWQDISKILDRFFLWFYLILIIVINIAFLTITSANSS
ncbi:neuronal acetylcholine receptor subunit alpha-3 [Patella vulgata]|uniref:neuronal acetylcholine receptor subunit alpha-3 n=1 Tax=Patella vulgata TaxID=6465 RepID=UPI0024A96C0D|nr:neuronal acetylcholine receptor subunit alpha-3 [Patella vulgata]